MILVELTFAVLFLRALFGYLRKRDPLWRDVTLVFLPCTALFCVDLARRANGGHLPTWIGITAVAILLAQPYLTVRLAGRLRAVPRSVHWVMIGAYLGIAIPIALAPRPLDPHALVAMMVAFALSEMVAALLLWGYYGVMRKRATEATDAPVSDAPVKPAKKPGAQRKKVG